MEIDSLKLQLSDIGTLTSVVNTAISLAIAFLTLFLARTDVRNELKKTTKKTIAELISKICNDLKSFTETSSDLTLEARRNALEFILGDLDYLKKTAKKWKKIEKDLDFFIISCSDCLYETDNEKMRFQINKMMKHRNNIEFFFCD